MKRRIDSKYEIEATGCNRNPDLHGKQVIRNVYNGNVIPEDEPLFIFRAKDRLAVQALVHYYKVCKEDGCTKEQLSGIEGMISEFNLFTLDNPDKMKQPGSTMPEDIKKLAKLGPHNSFEPTK